MKLRINYCQFVASEKAPVPWFKGLAWSELYIFFARQSELYIVEPFGVK